MSQMGENLSVLMLYSRTSYGTFLYALCWGKQHRLLRFNELHSSYSTPPTDGVCFVQRTASVKEIFRIKLILPAFLERHHILAAAKYETDQDGAVFLRPHRAAFNRLDFDLFQVTIRDQYETL